MRYSSLCGLFALGSPFIEFASGKDPLPPSLLAPFQPSAKATLIRITGNYEEIAFLPNGTRAKTAYASFQTILDLHSAEALRCDLVPFGIFQISGLTRFKEEKSTLVFDGKTWIHAIEESGSPSNRQPKHVAVRYKTFPRKLGFTDPCSTVVPGEGLILSRLRSPFGGLLRTALATEKQPVTVKAGPVADSIEVTMQTESTRDQLLLSTRQPGVLLRRKLDLNAGVLEEKRADFGNVATLTYSGHRQVAPGLWVPTEMEGQTQVGRDRRVSHTRITDLAILPPSPAAPSPLSFPLDSDWGVLDDPFPEPDRPR